jgi:ribose transport system substrate-binding protein
MRRLLTVALFSIVVALLLAACGGGSSTTSSSGTSSSGGKESASDTKESGSTGNLVEGPSETPPTTIPAGLTPLPKPPPKGIKVVTLQCDFPTCGSYTKVFEAAAKHLGWENKTIVFKTGQPQDAMTQAVNSPGVQYVNITGIPTSIIKPQLKTAAEKGIVVIKGSDPGPPEPPTVPVAITTAVGGSEQQSEGLMRWIINNSDGKANVAVVGLPEIPTVVPIPKTAERIAQSECPECTVEELPVTGEELAAGTVPSKVVAYLQAHPEVEYVWPAFGNLTLGVPEALKTAGLSEKVKIVTVNGIEPAEAEALKNGEIAAYNVAAQGEYATMAIDAIARSAEGLKFPQKVYAEAPQTWLCTPATAEKCAEWETFPPGFLKKFETQVWKVG